MSSHQDPSGLLFVEELPDESERNLLKILSRQYAEEMESALRYEWHAERMRYPQFRQRLFAIAKEEQRHAEWLAAKIMALGGWVPPVSFTPEEGLNSWECLSRDLEAENRCTADLTEELAVEKSIDPETAQTLRRILADELKHRKAIADMLMRSDPQAEGSC